jgi:hypothetical protein
MADRCKRLNEQLAVGAGGKVPGDCASGFACQSARGVLNQFFFRML